VDERARALEEIAALARRHGLTPADIAAALGTPPEPASEGRARSVLVRVLGYLGGTFVFAGVGVFIALQWDALGSAARVVITLGPGVAAFVLALLASRDPRYERASTPMFLIAAALQPTGMLVAFEEYGTGGDWRWASLIVTGTMALQQGAAFASLRRSTPLFLTIFFAVLCWWTAFDLLDADNTLIALVLGAAMLLAAVGADRSGYGAITPVWYFLGGAAFLAAVFDLVDRTALELLFLAVAALMVWVSVTVTSRMLLFVSTLAILAYTAWYTGEHFADSIGWPLALIFFGMVMIGLSALAFRIDREYLRRKPV
jgi:hypothetical protein